MSEEWPVLDSGAEYETGWYTGGYDLVEQPDGSTKRYYWAALPPAVVVVALDDGDVVLVEQYRPTIREHHLELPAGIVEREADVADVTDGDADPPEAGEGGTGDGGDGTHDGPRPAPDRESYAAAGARELREETGFAAESVTLVESFWCATGVLRHRRGVVVAEGLTHVGSDRDGNEFLTVERVPADEALAVARADPANDATIEGLLLARADGYL